MFVDWKFSSCCCKCNKVGKFQAFLDISSSSSVFSVFLALLSTNTEAEVVLLLVLASVCLGQLQNKSDKSDVQLLSFSVGVS